MFARFSRFYARSFEQRPWITLALTNGGLTMLADACAQSFERHNARRHLAPTEPKTKASDKKEPSSPKSTSGFDLARSCRFLTFGAIMAPPLDVWNKFLERRFPVIQAGGKVSLPFLLRRTVADQALFAPLGIAAFIGIMSVLEGSSRREIGDKYRNMYTEALVANWQVWPLAQLINFRFMPLKYRVPFVSSCGVLWTIYLSLLNMAKSGNAPSPEPLATEARA